MRLEDLGKVIDRSNNWLSRIERGTVSNPPEPDDFIKLSKVLGLSRLRMLRALGYLEDADLDTANGPAYQIQEGDPLVPIIDQLRGVPDADLDAIHQLIDVVLNAYSRKPVAVRHSGEDRTDTTEWTG